MPTINFHRAMATSETVATLEPGGYFKIPRGTQLADLGGSPRAFCSLPTLHILWQICRAENQGAAGSQGALEESEGDENGVQLPEDPSCQ